jgi:pimeloyl-ACP methyl ester carboxylesterase
MGGQIALELALACPERVRSLILLSSCAKMDERGRTVIELWGDLPKLVDPNTAIRLSLPWTYTRSFYASAGAIDEVIQEILVNPFPPSVSGIYQQSRAITSYDASDHLREIKCPTLVVVGDEDLLGGLPLSADLAHGVPGAQLVVLKQAAHGLLTESAEATAASMMDFLSDLRKRGNH